MDGAAGSRTAAVARLPADMARRQSGVWRLAAVASLAMADAAEAVAALPPGTIRLKWPNDLVVERRRRRP